MKTRIARFLKVAELAGFPVDSKKIEIRQLSPHEPQSLPAGKMGIYIFYYRGKCLKVGKAGAKSNARFTSQHYAPGRAKSNLAKSLLLDLEMKNKNLSEKEIGAWIKKNTSRTDILIDESLGVWTLNLLEAFLQYQCRPKYEGFKSQSG